MGTVMSSKKFVYTGKYSEEKEADGVGQWWSTCSTARIKEREEEGCWRRREGPVNSCNAEAGMERLKEDHYVVGKLTAKEG